ncbi:hypothetical protein [Pedobacter sp. SL55]|uniref:hypothetical protein n=1 Tax=Pedobacter sp. SL55 TaxID=2995161 RepID=UPI00226FF537|nr:hypothetical protein [Pedobacter sp. SL55]WAC42509.1 hypothetical protein OVA16_09205 [Pedobacter sp. SL55]
MKKTLAIVNGIALVSTIFINYLSNTGAFNGNTMKTVSDRYFNLFTPAGYAFSIWGLIYVGLLAFTIYTGKNLFNKQETHPALAKIGWWFLVSCLANSFWVLAWLYNYTLLSVVLMTVILVSLLRIVLNLNIRLTKQIKLDYIFIGLPFTMYVGWISVAIIANMAAFLTKIQWDGFGINATTWTVAMIVIAGLINIYMVAKRNMIAYGMVGIWALIAIADNQSADTKTIIYSCYAVSAAILLAIFANFRKALI